MRPQALDGALVRREGSCGFSFGPPHPNPSFHTWVARKGISFCHKQCFAPGIMDSCPPASAVRILNGVAGVFLPDLGATSTCSSTLRLLFLFFAVCFVSV